MNDLALWRDEVNEPLGLLPGPDARAIARTRWAILPVAAPAIVAVAMAAFTFGHHKALQRGEAIAARTEAPPPAPVQVESPQPTGSVVADKAAPPPIATADRVEAASGVKVGRTGAAAAPIPLIIDVQQALADQKAKAAPVVQR